MTILFALPYLLLASLVALMLSPVIALSTKSRKLPFALTNAAFAVVIITSIYVMLSGTSIAIFGYLNVSPFSAFFLMLFSSALVLVSIMAAGYSKSYTELSFLIGISFIAMFAIATAQSILPIFLGLEMITVSTSFMVLFHGKHRIEAAVKLFVTGSLAIAILSFSIALLFQYSPSLSLSPIPVVAGSAGGMALLAMALFITALGFESAIFPFNLWVADVYEGAPTFVTAMLAGINKKVGFLVLIEVLFTVFVLYAKVYSPMIEALAIFTMFFGNLLALNQKNLKRLFAYSSISQAGYILIGLAVASPMGIRASLFYIFSHTFMIIGAFAIILFLESNNIKTVEDCTALYSRNAFVAIAFTIIMLSMAGIPTLIGFFGKVQLFSSAIAGGMLALAVVGIINSLISVYYYARVINSMFQSKKEKLLLLDRNITAVIIVCLIVIIAFGLYPQPLILLASKAAGYLPSV